MTYLITLALLSGLGFDAPTGWVSKPSSSSMRVGVWELPGDDGSAEVVIFYFGEGSGGGVDANVARWLGQFEQPDGSSTRDKATITEREANGLKLTIADMRGTYVAPVRPGATQRNNRPNQRMLGIVAEGGSGPWYIRVLGPEATMAKWEASVEEFLSSLRLE